MGEYLGYVWVRELGGQDRHAKRCRDFLHLFACRFAYIRRIRKCGASAGMIYAVSRECLFPAYARLPQRVTERLAYLAVRLRG